MLDISPYPTLIQLKYFIGGIHYCVTVVGKWVLTVIFLLHFLSKMTIWTTVALIIMKKKGMNGYKGVLKSIRFSQKKNDKSELHKWKFITFVS